MNRFISLGEVRLGLRLIVKQPILSVTIILALATGVCLTTMGFTFREELVNGRLPYQAGDRFARFYVLSRAGNPVEPNIEQYHAIRDRAISFEHVGAFGVRSFTLTRGPGEVESIQGTYLTARSMAWLEASPLAGPHLDCRRRRAGRRAGDRHPREHVAEPIWRRPGNDRPAAHGRRPAAHVVGILPESFRFPSSGELWVPLDELTLAHSITELRMLAVLRPGVSFEVANCGGRRPDSAVGSRRRVG